MMEPREVERFERHIDAMLRVAASDDPEGFAQIVRLIDAAQARLPEAAQALRQRDGYSWADLARPLGVTRGAACQRFGRK